MKIVAIVASRPLWSARRAKMIGADRAEFRLDLLSVRERGEVSRIRGTRLFTARLSGDGGHWTGPEEARLDLLGALARRGDWVDLEMDRASARRAAGAFRRRGVRVAASRHHFGPFPSPRALDAWLAAGARMGDAVKIAVMVRSRAERERLVAWARGAARRIGARRGNERLTVVGMGARGRETRWRLPREIGGFAYAPLGRAVAPGQIGLREMVRCLKG